MTILYTLFTAPVCRCSEKGAAQASSVSQGPPLPAAETVTSHAAGGPRSNQIPKLIQNVNLIPKEKNKLECSDYSEQVRRAVSCGLAKGAPKILEEHARRGSGGAGEVRGAGPIAFATSAM